MMAAPFDLSERWTFMFSYTFHWNQAFKVLPQLLDGAVVTLQIAILSMAAGLAFAIALTLFRPSMPIRWSHRRPRQISSMRQLRRRRWPIRRRSRQ